MKTKKKFLIAFILISLFTIDRFIWMPERIDGLFLWEAGPMLGDPIVHKQDFVIENSHLIFNEYKNEKAWPETGRNRKSKLFLAGCYFGNLLIYDLEKQKLIRYSKK